MFIIIIKLNASFGSERKFKFNPVFINQVQSWYIDHPSGYGLHDKHGYSLINSNSEYLLNT